MSISCSSAVRVARLTRLGLDAAHKLVLLSLADRADDAGRNTFPAVQTLADEAERSPRHVRKLLRDLEAAGLIVADGPAIGGAPSRASSCRRWAISLVKLASLTPVTGDSPTPVTCDTPPELTPVTHDRDPCHPRPGPLSPVTAEPSLTVLEPPTGGVIDANPTHRRRVKPRVEQTTLSQWLERERNAGRRAVPADDPIHHYAELVGIDQEMLVLAWEWLRDKYEVGAGRLKKQIDWRKYFRNSVRGNWSGYWFMREGESARWTTKGEQARREFAAQSEAVAA
jgi:hypothetical protein